jgi:hypothetical protein
MASIWDTREVFEFLRQVRKAYGEDKPPLNLVILPKDYNPYQYEFLVDEFLTSPFDPALFWDTVRKLATDL